MTPAARFGAQLRRERERAGVSLESIARKTNITASHFAALERGDCSHWPPGVYSRSFLRGYAIAVGLHPEQVLAEAAQYFSNFHDDGLPLSVRCPETKHELRLQLDPPGPDWSRRWRALGVLALDAGIAAGAGVVVMFAGGSFWITAAIVLTLCYGVAMWRSATPRSAFVLPKGPARPVVPGADGETFSADEPLDELVAGTN